MSDDPKKQAENIGKGLGELGGEKPKEGSNVPRQERTTPTDPKEGAEKIGEDLGDLADPPIEGEKGANPPRNAETRPGTGGGQPR